MLYGLPPFYSRNQQEMYQAILTQPLVFKASGSHTTRHLLKGLLQKDPKRRLGSSDRDWQDIKNHDFFKSINFNDLLQKKNQTTL